MDARARLTEILAGGAINEPLTRHLCEQMADRLLAAGATLPEPALTEDATRALAALHGYTGSCAASHVRLCPSCQATAREVQGGLLPLAEVERRARAWVAEHRSFGYGVESLVAALTRGTRAGTKGVGE